MDAPFLFDYNRLVDKSLNVFRRQAFINCGRELPAYRHLKEKPPVLMEYLTSASDEFQTAWRDEIAAEALIAGLADDRIKRNFPFQWVDPEAKPCGKFGPTYAECRGKPLALALFPLADEFDGGVEPTVGRIWLFDRLTSASQTLPELDGIEHFGEAQIGASRRMIVDIAAWKEEYQAWPSGQSWQLAAHVAAKMLEENCRLVELATSWMASGVVAGHEVKKIGLMNKLKLDLNGRQWLLPLSNRNQISPDILASSVFYLSEAFTCIRGSNSECLLFRENKVAQKPEIAPPVRYNDLKEKTTTKPKGKPMNSNQSAQLNEPVSNVDNNQLVIYLTNRRPVRISTDKWPVIMKVDWCDVNEMEHTRVTGNLTVRAQQVHDNNIRYLVHGNSRKDDDAYGTAYSLIAGELLNNCTQEDPNNHAAPELIESIKNVSKSLKQDGDTMLGRLLNSMEPEVLD